MTWGAFPTLHSDGRWGWIHLEDSFTQESGLVRLGYLGLEQLELLRHLCPRWSPSPSFGGCRVAIPLRVAAQGSVPGEGEPSRSCAAFYWLTPASGVNQRHFCPVGQNSFKSPPKLKSNLRGEMEIESVTNRKLLWVCFSLFCFK